MPNCKTCDKEVDYSSQLTAGECKICRSGESRGHVKFTMVVICGVVLCAMSMVVGALMCSYEHPYWPFVLHGPICIIVLTILACVMIDKVK